MKPAIRRALITGIGGQDGSYLAELLLLKGYEVHGIDLPDIDLPNIAHIADRVVLYRGSLLDVGWLLQVVVQVVPDECYHLAASSFVSYRFEDEANILNNNIGSTHNLLAALVENAPKCHFFFAGTSEMFGTVDVSPQNEDTPLRPRSVYGISKVAGHQLTNYYRMQHGLFACTGILYNHESPRRGQAFVTRKITSTAAKIKLGLEEKLTLGNLDAERDWGYAPDYVQAMWQMQQAEVPEDYVISSGELHTVRELVEAAFSAVGLDYRDYVETSPEFFREKENISLRGDSRRIEKAIGWKPNRPFTEIVTEMVIHDLALLEATINS